MSDFYATRMGQRFYESTMPRLVDELARLNGLLERIAVTLEADDCRSNENTDGTPDSSKSNEKSESSLEDS